MPFLIGRHFLFKIIDAGAEIIYAVAKIIFSELDNNLEVILLYLLC